MRQSAPWAIGVLALLAILLNGWMLWTRNSSLPSGDISLLQTELTATRSLLSKLLEFNLANHVELEKQQSDLVKQIDAVRALLVRGEAYGEGGQDEATPLLETLEAQLQQARTNLNKLTASHLAATAELASVKQQLQRTTEEHKKEQQQRQQCESTCNTPAAASSGSVPPPVQGILTQDQTFKLAGAYRMSELNYCDKPPMNELRDAFKGYTMWTSDFHIGPIACQNKLWQELGLKVIAKISYLPYCERFNMCRGDIKVIPDGAPGYYLGHCYNKMRRDFFEAYKNDPEMNTVDVFMCTHPTANCELFLPFNRSMIVYEHTRLEFSRNDIDTFWHTAVVRANPELSHKRWVEWRDALVKMSQRPNIVVAANNVYDVHYIKYHTDIDAVLIPSSCTEELEGATYNPIKPEIIIGGSRNNVDENHPVWKEMRATFERLNAQTTPEQHVVMKQLKVLYPYYHWWQIAQHPAVVLTPYTISTMSLIEYYRLAIPLFLPSLSLAVKWELQYRNMWERIAGFPEPRGPTRIDYNPNSWNLEDLLYWISFSDWYQWPHIQYYDSAEDLYWKLKTTNLTRVSENMKQENERLERHIRQTWYQVFKTAFRDQGPPGTRQTPQDFEQAMWDAWQIKVGPNDECTVDPAAKKQDGT